jgi:hypothetical protein
MKRYSYLVILLLVPLTALLAQTGGKQPGYSAGFFIVTADDSGKGMQLANSKEYYSLGKNDSVSFANIDTVYKNFDPGMKKYVLSFRFNKAGTKELADFTKNYNGKKIGLVIGDKLITVATIYSPITFGRVNISGNHTEEEKWMAPLRNYEAVLQNNH